MTQADNIIKARSGIYEDNSKNRRLHRVGQHYGGPKQPDDTPLEERTRVSFPDVPHASRVNLQKYLSGAVRKRFDMTEMMASLKTTEDVQKFHDRMVEFFEGKFDTLSKADRAGWLFVVLQAKKELVKRLASGDPNGEPMDAEDQDVNFGPEEEDALGKNKRVPAGLFGPPIQMSREAANSGSNNPHWKESEAYKTNCQSCVVSYEMRRRGYDVEALPFLNPEQKKLARSGNEGLMFLDPSTGEPSVPKRFCGFPLGVERGTKNELTRMNLRKNFNTLTAAPGRYQFSYAYFSNRRLFGHIVSVERFPDGRVVLYDPQISKERDLTEIIKKMNRQYVARILRVDDKMINTEMANKIVKKK